VSAADCVPAGTRRPVPSSTGAAGSDTADTGAGETNYGPQTGGGSRHRRGTVGRRRSLPTRQAWCTAGVADAQGVAALSPRSPGQGGLPGCHNNRWPGQDVTARAAALAEKTGALASVNLARDVSRVSVQASADG